MLSTVDIAASCRKCIVSIEPHHIFEHVGVKFKKTPHSWKKPDCCSTIAYHRRAVLHTGQQFKQDQRQHIHTSRVELFDRSTASRTKKNQNKWTQITFKRKLSTNVWAQGSNWSRCGFVPRWPLTVMVKDRSQIHRQGQATRKLDLPPKFQNRSTQSTQRPPPNSKRRWLFTTEQLYFLL